MATQRCSREELEKERTPSELRSWLNQKVKQICSTKDGLEDFRLQKGPLMKQLVEEVRPLAIFGKQKYGNTDQVFLQPVIGNQNYDAKVIDRRTVPAPVGYVEITQAHEGGDEYLRRRELLQKGIVFSRAPVIKQGKGKNRMVSIPPEATPVEDGVSNELNRIAAAARRKVGKCYPTDTSLVIFFDDTFPREAMSDVRLDSFVNENVLTMRLRFSTLYLVGQTGEVFREYPINRRRSGPTSA